MNITDIRIRKVAKEGKLKAVASITIDGEFVVHDIKIIDGFRVVNTYSPYKGCMKDVVLFVAIPTSFKLQRQIEEVKRLGWFSIKKALSLLTHESDKQILKNAYKFFVDYLSFSLD